MAQTLNTVVYVYEQMGTLSTIPTFFGNITVALPDIAVVANPFKAVKAVLTANDNNTVATSNTSRSIEIGFNSGPRTVYTNANTITNSAESIALRYEVDLTSQFNSGFVGTSNVVDAVGSSSASYRQGNLHLEITYVKDTTATTQVKTVYLPLDTNRSSLPNAKGGATCTIPALDTELPEAGKSYVNRAVWLWGTSAAQSLTDYTLSTQIDTGATATAYFEGAMTTAVWVDFKSVAVISAMTTNATHSFYVWASATGGFYNLSGMIIITYTYDATTTTRLFVSQIVPWDVKASALGVTPEWQHSRIQVKIPEANITTKNIALYGFVGVMVAWSTFSLKFVPTVSVNYIGFPLATYSGGAGFMLRNDAAYTLARGTNTIEVQLQAGTAQNGRGPCGFYLVNYTCDVPSTGIGTESRFIRYPMAYGYSGTVSTFPTGTSAPTIPDTWWAMSNLGVNLSLMANNGSVPTMILVEVERNTGVSSVNYEPVLSTFLDHDGETGPSTLWSSVEGVFGSWDNATIIPNNPWLNLQTSRSWRIGAMQAGSYLSSFWYGWDYTWIQHQIYHTISGTISNSSGGLVYIDLVSIATGEMFRQGSRTGDGAFSLTWHDDYTPTYLLIRDVGDPTRSAVLETLTYASGTPNDNINVGTIDLSVGGAPVPYRIVNGDTRIVRPF